MNSIQLAENISSMVNNGYYIMGHAIFLGRGDFHFISNKILNEGILIQDSTKGISFTARYFESEYSDCVYNLLDLAKNSAGSVVVIAIPGELLSYYDSKYFESCDKTSILLEDTSKFSDCYSDIFGNPTSIALLPSIYILGYLDVQQDFFIENSNFAFKCNVRNKNVSELKPLLDKKYEKILKKIR